METTGPRPPSRVPVPDKREERFVVRSKETSDPGSLMVTSNPSILSLVPHTLVEGWEEIYS